MLEIEAKIKLKNREELLSKGNLISKSKNSVSDIYYDKNGELKSDDKVLRLRKQNDKAYLAMKGPRSKDKNLVVRTEYEQEISDFDLGKKMLALLDFSPVQVVEKVRETFILDGCDVKIELDLYPFIGFYLELEGKKDSIQAVMNKFGYSMEDAITKNCTELFFEYIKNKNIHLDEPRLHYTFEEEKKYKES